MGEAALARQRVARDVEKAKRVRLLGDETDRLLGTAEERAKSVDSKSSFLAVAAGIVIAAALAQKWSAPNIVALLPVFFAVVALALSAIALRPGRRKDLTPAKITGLWVDSEQTAATAELRILEAKVQAFDLREDDLRGRAKIGSYGFASLLISSVCLVVVYALEIF